MIFAQMIYTSHIWSERLAHKDITFNLVVLHNILPSSQSAQLPAASIASVGHELLLDSVIILINWNAIAISNFDQVPSMYLIN